MMRFFVLILCLLTGTARAQESMPGRPISCYGSGTTHSGGEARQRMGYSGGRQQRLANLEVTYVRFPAGAQRAFQQAIDTWATVLRTPVPIRIRAVWDSLPGNALALTRATKVYRGFAGAAQPDIWYPVALAEKLTGHDLNGTTEADIEITLNRTYNWYVGTDGNPPASQTDLVTVVLHEMAHGLGFMSGTSSQGSNGLLRDAGYVLVYDALLANKAGVRLAAYADPSPQLLAAFMGGDLYLQSPTAASFDQNRYPKVFAPAFYTAASSLSHLDEIAYPPGNANALLTPYLGSGESVQAIGPVVLGILADLGWAGDSNGPATDALIYPNPGTGLYTVRLPAATAALSMRVVDLTGRVLKTVSQVAASSLFFDLSDLTSGLYLVQISTPTGLINRKLILLR